MEPARRVRGVNIESHGGHNWKCRFRKKKRRKVRRWIWFMGNRSLSQRS